MIYCGLMNGISTCRRLSTLLSVVLIAINVAFVQCGATQNGGMDNHFVLIHGLGHGAWSWYKVVTLLQSQGNKVTTLDLTSNGINKVVADQITSVAQYAKPLIDFLESNITRVNEKVILVGHSLGGGVISYVMEHFPSKVEKAIFVCAFMPSNGQSLIPMQDLQALRALFQDGGFGYNYGNGSSSRPTSLYINLANATKFFYNKSPIEDINLAFTLLNPTPYGPLTENLTLTLPRYGRIKRYYIKATMDHAIEPSLQEKIVQDNPPNQVFTINGSDHSSFFSYPRALCTILNTIAKDQAL